MPIVIKSTTKKKRPKLLNLTKYSNKGLGIRMLSKDIHENIKSEIFSYRDMNTLIFQCLKQIKQVNRQVKNDPKSIELAAETVLRLKGFQGPISATSKESWTDLFVLYYVGLKSTPAQALEYLSGKVQIHLREVAELIKYYESQPCIVEYLKSGRVPSNHSDGIVFDFYHRCIREQKIILNYFLFEMRQRALFKPREELYMGGVLEMMFINYRDFPYRFGHDHSMEYFDHRKISKYRHRIGEVLLIDKPEYAKLYNEGNKKKFYQLLFRITPQSEILQRIEYHLKHLPQVANRKEIFDELIRLFKAKRWLAFYALALPQIEGLFTDMVNIAVPNKKLQSLPEKVNALRPYHDYSDNYFDYYQYIVPIQRNKFMHVGHDDEIKEKAFDLFTDLDHLLGIYSSLNDPYIKIQSIQSHKKWEDFTTCYSFAEYFKQLKQLEEKNPKKYKELAHEIAAFEKDFLNIHCNIEFTCDTAMFDLANTVGELEGIVEHNFDMDGIAVAFRNLPKPAIEKHLKDERRQQRLLNFFQIYSSNMESLESLKIFFEGCIDYLPNLNSEKKKEVVHDWNQHKNAVNNILLLRELIEG